MRRHNQIEILAPAGSYECFRAAMNAGADAVYAAGARFGARAYADNFTQEELIQAIREAHVYGKRFYLTVNTLLKDSEMDELYDYLAPLYEKGLDAVIVQDPGVFSFIREHFPGMDLHASTQMTLTNALGAQLLEQQGAARVVPARELSLQEVQKIHETTDLEIECFVHGALCYCYSGQCLLSSMIGGRSGNRGQCAQPCRLPYTVNGKKQYFMSLKDICTLELIPEMIEAGIDSFKIEGRMKKPEYVAGVTSMYRKYTDLYLKHGKEGYHVSERDREQLMDLYNRGNSDTGYYVRHNGKDMLALDRPNHAGVPAVRVLSQKGREVTGAALTDLHAQDVLELGGGKNNYTLGSPVKKGKTLSFLVPKGFRLAKDSVISRIRNEQLIQRIHTDYLSDRKQVPVDGFLYLNVNEPAQLTLCCRDFAYTAYSELPAVQAEKRPLEEERVRTQLQKTGESMFYFDTLEISMSGDVFLPMQQLNTLRRAALDGLEEMIAVGQYRTLESDGIRRSITAVTEEKEIVGSSNGFEPQNEQVKADFGYKTAKKEFSVLVETEEQLDTILKYIKKVLIMDQTDNEKGTGSSASKMQITRLYPDFRLCGESFKNDHFKAEFQQLQENGIEIYPVMPSIFRENAVTYFENQKEQFSSYPMDGVLIRNYETYEFLRQHGFDKKIITDHNLYIFNQEGKAFWSKLGADEFTAPVELNGRELEVLGISQAELIVYGAFPVMVSAQCIRNTSSGCTKTPGVLSVQDRMQQKYPVKNFCDFCYNIMYYESPVCLAQEQEQIETLSPKRLRLQFTTEEKEATESVLDLFTALFSDDSQEKMQKLQPQRWNAGHFKRGIM